MGSLIKTQTPTTTMKLIFALTALFGLSVATKIEIQGKQYASEFLKTRRGRTTRAVDQPWEWKEAPWENLREYINKNSESLGVHESHVEYVNSCTEKYAESYEDYD